MPKRAAATPLIALDIDREAEQPLYTQLYAQLRDAILAGRLGPGTRLPSTRLLAAEHGMSRNTVLTAYEQLLYEGYVEGQVGSGTRVSSVLPEDLLAARNDSPAPGPVADRPPRLSALAERMTRMTPRPTRRFAPFQPGVPEVDEFPFDVWGRLLARTWRPAARDLAFFGDLAGHPPLRRAIAAYLGAVRGIACSADNIIITAGAQQAIDLLVRALLDAGDAVWMEEPGYAGLRGAFTAAGADVVAVPLDGEGLSVTAGRLRAPHARMAAVTPSHQYPLGVTMSLARRLELLDWAREGEAWILEDDYDSEYRYTGRPVPALQGLDDAGRVLYVGTFSKVMFPALRLGYLVVPDSLVDPLLAMRGLLDDQTSIVAQPALAEFIDQGHFAAHVRRMRRLYAERQHALVDKLRSRLGGIFDATLGEAGLHMVAMLDSGATLDETEIERRAASAGLVVTALGRYYAEAPDETGVMFGFAGFPVETLTDAVDRLAIVLDV